MRLGVVNLDVEAEWWLEPGHEGLYPLRLRQHAHARQQGLKPVLILRYRVGSLARHEFAQRIGTDRRPEAKVQKLAEATPRGGALVLLHLDKPHQGAGLQVV